MVKFSYKNDPLLSQNRKLIKDGLSAYGILLKKEDMNKNKKGTILKKSPYLIDKKREIKHMLKTGVKLELEALSAKNFRFITEKYVPDKIKNKDFLD